MTRANEFARDHSKPISDNNFDAKRYQQELHTLVARINETIKISQFTTDDFIAIDNIQNYNINALRTKVIELCKNNNESLLHLHNRKLSYFKSEIKKIHTFYLELSREKTTKCKEFIDKAEENIEHFDQQTEISKVRFNSLSKNTQQIFDSIYNGNIKSHIDGLILELSLIEDIFGKSIEFIDFKNFINNKIDTYSQILASGIVSKMENFASDELNSIKRKLVESDNYKSFTIDTDELLKRYDEITISIKTDFPVQHDTYYEKFTNSYLTKNARELKNLKNIFEKAHNTIHLKRNIDTIKEKITDYKNAAIELLNLYYNAIIMYNSAVFSFDVKNYISELGLAKELDRIESSGFDKIKYDLLAEQILLGNYKDIISVFEADLTTFHPSLISIDNQIKKLDLNLSNNINNKNTFNNLTQFKPIVGDILSLINRTKDELVGRIDTLTNGYNKQVKAIKKKRNIIRLVLFFIPLILLGIIWLLSTIENIQMPTSISGSSVIAIICSIAANVIYNIFGNYKSKVKELLDTFKNELDGEVDHIIKTALDDFKKSNKEKEVDLVKIIKNTWIKQDNEIFQKLNIETYNNIHQEIINIRNSLQNILKNYKDLYISFFRKIKSLFNEEDNLNEKLETIAKQIKEDSIKPSFQLLNNTLNEIRMVKNEIENIEY